VSTFILQWAGHRRGPGGRNGGRGRGRGGNRNRFGRVLRKPPVQTFFGNTDGMKGNIFQCHGESTTKEQFLRTVGVLEEHMNKTFDYPQDVASVCKSFDIKPPTMPANLEKFVYEGDMGKRMIWETAMKTYMKRSDKLESNTRAIYAIVWGQCSPMMQSKLESLDEYTERSSPTVTAFGSSRKFRESPTASKATDTCLSQWTMPGRPTMVFTKGA
jgi:hypothetical protein